ncbi:MAG: NFACT family protein [Nitrososphaerota archaeon]
MVQLNALELAILVEEIGKAILGGLVRNVYQPTSSAVVLKMSSGGGTLELWAVAGECVFYTDLEVVKPPHPTSFATFLRKVLNGLKVGGVSQLGSERVVKLVFGDGSREMVVELMPPGNIFILDNSKIVRIMRPDLARARGLRPGQQYMPPQPRYSYMMGHAEPSLLKRLRPDSPVVASLSRDLGLGGKFAEEVLARSSIDKNVLVRDLSSSQVDEILSVLVGLERELRRPSPRVYMVGSSPIPALIPLQHVSAEFMETSSFSEAVARSYLTRMKYEEMMVVSKPLRDRLQELERRLGEKENVIAGLRVSERRLGEALKLLEAWAGTLSTSHPVEGSGLTVTYDGRMMEVRAGEHVFRLRRDLSIRRQISQQYDELKKIRQTVERLEEQKTKIMREMDEIRRKLELAEPAIPMMQEGLRCRSAATSRVREFISSDGYKVVSGRDARTNIKLLRNMMGPKDLILHAEIPGSPVTVVTNGSEAPYTTMEEAAQFTACYSRAWKEGFTSASVYYVEPAQISLSAPSGTYLPRGSFMVYGKRRFIEVQLRLAVIGGRDSGILIVPQLTASRMGLKYVELRPGKTESSVAAREALHLISAPTGKEMVEELASKIPYGRCSVFVGDKLIRT